MEEWAVRVRASERVSSVRRWGWVKPGPTTAHVLTSFPHDRRWVMTFGHQRFQHSGYKNTLEDWTRQEWQLHIHHNGAGGSSAICTRGGEKPDNRSCKAGFFGVGWVW